MFTGENMHDNKNIFFTSFFIYLMSQQNKWIQDIFVFYFKTKHVECSYNSLKMNQILTISQLNQLIEN